MLPLCRPSLYHGGSFKLTCLDWQLTKFVQLKRCKGFDDLIMLVWSQGSIFYTAADQVTEIFLLSGSINSDLKIFCEI